MKIDEIINLWKEDTYIDKTELGDESIKIPKLHHKYYQIFIGERILYKHLESEYKQLKLEKYEFFTQGPSEVSKEKGWEFPAKGIILKSDVSMYMEADKDLIKLSLKIGMQEEKIQFLESIIKSLNNRGFQIKTAVDFIKWTNGS